MAKVRVERDRQRFAGELQAALTREEVNQAYLRAVDQVIPADGLGLYELDEQSGSVRDVRAVVEGDVLDVYEEIGRRDDPVLNFVVEHHRPIDSSRVVPLPTWESCGAREALGGSGYFHSMEAPVLVAGTLFGTINFARKPGQTPFTSTDLASARLVGEQLGIATERALRFELTGARCHALERALDRVPEGVVITDLDARLLFQNRSARNEWKIGGGGSGVPQAIESSIAESMQDFRQHGKRVAMHKIYDHSTGREALVKTYRLSDKAGTAVSLIFPYQGEDSPQRLPAWDVLTKREQEIAQLVSDGLTTKQIAAEAYISENTVKQHLKRVFAKTDVSNRAELVQLIWTNGRRGHLEEGGSGA